VLISEILKAAKARLTPETCGQGSQVLPLVGRLCPALAITVCWASSQHRPVRAAYQLFAQTATGTDGSEYQIPIWNDTPGRTLQEVHDAFDAAIAIAEQQDGLKREHDGVTEVADARSLVLG
jgi:hypothetical protein